MITEIETAILERITARIAGIAASGIQKDARGKLVNPLVVTAAVEGRFSRVGQVNWQQDLEIVTVVQFKQLQGETQRRSGIQPLAQGIIQLMLNWTPVAGCQPLRPKRWRESTTEEQYGAGIIEFMVELTTSFILTPLDDETVTDLLRIGLNYYLQPDDGAVDAQDVVEVLGQ